MWLLKVYFLQIFLNTLLLRYNLPMIVSCLSRLCIFGLWFSKYFIIFLRYWNHLCYLLRDFSLLRRGQEPIMLYIGNIIMPILAFISHPHLNSIFHQFQRQSSIVSLLTILLKVCSNLITPADQFLDDLYRYFISLSFLKWHDQSKQIIPCRIERSRNAEFKNIQKGSIYEYILGQGDGCSFLSIKILYFRKVQQYCQKMRSKQRRNYKRSIQTTQFTLTPNPHLKYHRSSDRLQQFQPESRVFRQSHTPQKSQQKQKGCKLQQLMKQNSELRKEIIQLKVHQFYHFDDDKLKELLKQVEQLRKEVKRQKQMISDLQLQNDFLKRTNNQLKLQLQKDLQAKTKQNYLQDISKCTLKYAHTKNSQNQITQLASTSGINFSQHSAFEDALDSYRHQPTKNQSRSTRKNLVERCLSPRRKDEASQSANEYLLFRRNKQRNAILQKITQ